MGAEVESGRENEAEDEVSEVSWPNREGLGGQGFYSEPDEKPPRG